MPERWKSRLRTVAAIAALCGARLTVAALPFARWRGTLGGRSNCNSETSVSEARQLAPHIEWAARLLPFSTKCLPRAMALSWLLRSEGMAHCLVFAVRPAELRGSDDQLHAWVEVAGEKIIGDLPGPWVETLRIGDDAMHRGSRSV
jgi:hypothetical protein